MIAAVAGGPDAAAVDRADGHRDRQGRGAAQRASTSCPTSRLPAGAAGGGAGGPLRARGARPGLPAGQPGRGRAPDGELPAVRGLGARRPDLARAGTLDVEKAFFTSRGIGVIDVNYGGSTGYGRSYRERLRRQWGVVDVEDAKAAALSLAAQGHADRTRLAIRGGSAGGWTALAAVTTGATRAGPVFAAATSYYGVSDLRGFVGADPRLRVALPGRPDRAAARASRPSTPSGPRSGTSPAPPPRCCCCRGWTTRWCRPPSPRASPPTWPRTASGYAYIAFEGESHGFRKAESIITALEAELSFYGQILGFSRPASPGRSLRWPARPLSPRLREAGRARPASGRTRWRGTRAPR